MRPILFLAFLLAGCAPLETGARGGIVSLNPCSDQLLLELVPPERIAAISHYSRDRASSSIAPEIAARFPTTAGTAEEVIALAPDLVIATSFTPPATRAAFERAGLRTLYLDSPTTIAASQKQVQELAQVLGAEARGAALNRRIDAAVAQASHRGQPVAALLYLSGDLVNGGGTLLGELLAVAGFRDAAADYGLATTSTLPMETILARPPALILSPDDGGRTAAIRRRLLERTGANVREEILSPALTNCGGSTIPAALTRLAEIRRGLPR